jgi:hypothetical protein
MLCGNTIPIKPSIAIRPIRLTSVSASRAVCGFFDLCDDGLVTTIVGRADSF